MGKKKPLPDWVPRRVVEPNYSLDGLGTFEPRPGGTMFAFGHREDPLLLQRILRQCYFDIREAEGESIAFHTAKRLHEQLTGSIDQPAVRRLIHPQPSGPAWQPRLPEWCAVDAGRYGVIG